MSYNDEKNKGYREYEEMFTLLLDVNAGDFSADPSSYNTPKTTNDSAAYLKGNIKPYSYGNTRLGFTNVFPNLNSISITPAVLKIGEDVALSASAKISLTDFPTNDTFELPPAFANRRVLASHFGKLFERNYVINRDCEILQGYGSATFDPANFQIARFVVKGFTYPDQKAGVNINLIDRLFFASESKNKCPATSTATLDGLLNNANTTLNFKGESFGDKALSDHIITLGDIGTINIDNELMTYDVTAYDAINKIGTLTVARGISGGDAASEHEDLTTIQGVVAFNAINATDIIRTLFNDFTRIGIGFIDDAAYDALKAGSMSQFNLTNKIAEPTEVKKLLKELMQSTGAYLYFDVFSNLIVLGYITQFEPSVITLNEREHILKDSLTVKPQVDKQVTRAKIAFGKRNYTESSDLKYYSNTYENRNDAIEKDENYGQVYDTKVIKSNWFLGSGTDILIAQNIVALKVIRFSEPPELFTFKLDSRYVGDLLGGGRLWYGSVVDVITKRRIGVNGKPKINTCQVISVQPDSRNDSFLIKALSYTANIPQSVDLYITQDATSINLADLIVPTEVKEYIVLINSGVQIGGLNQDPTFTPAITQGVFPVGATLKIINQGYIVGFGGNGAISAYWNGSVLARVAENGQGGGISCVFSTDVTIDTGTGIIGGGGGGAGGGGLAYISESGLQLFGGGGGGGAGKSAGIGAYVSTGLQGEDGNIATGGFGSSGFRSGVNGGRGGDLGSGGDNPPVPTDTGFGIEPSGINGIAGDAIHMNGNILTIDAGASNIIGAIVP